MNILPSKRAMGVTYAIRNIVHAAKELEKKGKKIIYCNIGDPCKFDFSTPTHMIDAVYNAMKKGENGYAPSGGVDEAISAISKHIREYNKIESDNETIFITSGASEAIEIALTALLNTGENVLTPAPGYPLYNAVINKIGAELNPYYLNDQNNWFPDLDDIEKKINKSTKGIVIINPNNPTGSVYEKEILLGLIEIARKHKLVLFSDEIYDKLLFEKKHISLASLCDDVPILTFNGLSKSYLVPGWRTGWMIVSNLPKSSDYFSCIKKLLDARLCSVGPQQFAIKAALEGPQDHIVTTLKKLKERRDLVFNRLNSIPGISCVKPEAAFYAMPKLESDAYETDEEFIMDFLKETGVLFVHGSGFETKPNTKYFRIVFLPQTELLVNALDALENFMKARV